MLHRITVGREPPVKRRYLAATALAGGAFAALWLAPGTASALPINLLDGQLTGNFDTTVSVGASVRAQDRDLSQIGIRNGGTAGSINNDDGNLNYGRGDLTTGAAKALHELDLKYRNYGLFGRFYYFYDPVIVDTDTDRTKLPNAAKTISGRDAELLDLYGSAQFEIVGTDITVKVGNQVLNWGESTFIPNGINVINPVDVAKLRTAGAEIKEALLPVPAVDVRIGLSKRFSVEGFYQFAFKNTELDPAGTFFSANDFASPGGKFAYTGFGTAINGTNDNPNAGQFIPRALDDMASDQGQFGFALRYFEPALNDSEFGLYYIRHHSRLPLLSGRTPRTVGGLATFQSSQYFREFPEDIDLYGASFNTTIERLGLSLFGEANYRRDQPLQVDLNEVLFSTLSAAGTRGQLGTFAAGGNEVSGFKRKDVAQAQMSALKVFGPNFGASQFTVIGEVGGTLIRDMEEACTLRYQGPGVYYPGSFQGCVAGAVAAAQRGSPAVTQQAGFPDAFSWGYRVTAAAQYNNVFGPVGLTPSLAFAHDVKGTTPGPLNTFLEDRKSVTAALRASYQNNLRAELSYTTFFGGDVFNVINDRDFVSLSFSYSF
jgi:Protein of unknown function (DUF1302)